MCIVFFRLTVTNEQHANISWDIVFCRRHFSDNVRDSHVVVFPTTVVVAYGTGFDHVTMNVGTVSKALPFVGNYQFLERILNDGREDTDTTNDHTEANNDDMEAGH